jgi:hypothetical protein
MNAKCIRCGVALHEAAPAMDEGVPLTGPSLSKSAWRALGIGFGLAVVISFFPFTALLFHPLMTIIHELGHATTAWSFGYPALPAFDFSEGGGVTSIPEERSIPIVFGIYGLVAYAMWRTRKHIPTVIVIAALTAAHVSISITPLHEGLIIGMGHGLEPVFAAVFIYRAMTGTTLLQADERPAYAMVGFLMIFDRLSFFYKLATDSDFQAWYNEGKSYADNDLVRIADAFWNTSVAHMAQLFVILWLSIPFIARLFYRLEGPISMWWSRFETEEDEAAA